MYNDQMLSINANLQSQRKLKFIRKYMKLAETIANDNNACYSRYIGCVIADYNNRVVGLGYNGPPTGTPHTDQYEYLKNFFIPQLTVEELKYLVRDPNTIDSWCKSKQDCRICPRRFVNAGPGERSTLCSCQHAERNAITNASVDLHDCSIYCWCGVPCIDCSGAIINSGIKEVHCLYVDEGDYHPESRFLLKTAGIELFEYRKEYFQV